MGTAAPPPPKVEPPKPPEPLMACIAAVPHRTGVTKCGRSVEREWVFGEADHAVAHYDARNRRILDSQLRACPRCIDVRKREREEETAANAK
jgi:hypothetical protein